MAKLFENSKHRKLNTCIFLLILLGSVLAMIKYIVVGIQIDEEYAFSMSYRLITGDRLLTQIWDPHQTSAFLIQFFATPFVKLTGSTDYLIIWVRFCATLIHVAVSVYLYKTLTMFLPKDISAYLSLIFFNILPKKFITPEFSNMIVWSVTLICILMIRLELSEFDAKSVKPVILSVLMGIVTFVMFLSYPSSVIVFPFVIIYFIVKRKSLPRFSLLAYVVSTVLLCLIYFLYFLFTVGLGGMFANARNVLSSCGSHSGPLTDKILLYAENFGIVLCMFAVASLLSIGISFLIIKIRSKKTASGKKLFIPIYLLVFFSLSLLWQLIYWTFTIGDYTGGYDYFYFFILVIFAFIIIFNVRKDGDKIIPKMLFPIASNVLLFVSVIMLTNLHLFSSITYISSGVVFSLATLYLFSDKKYGKKITAGFRIIIIAACFVAAFIKGWSYVDDEGFMRDITCISNMMKEGPGKGLLTEYMKGYINNTTFEEMHNFVDDDSVLLIGGGDTLFYMDKNYKVGTYTTISTPYYDSDSLKTYYENNPEKYPDVVMIPCWYGTLRIPEDDYLYLWTLNEFEYTSVYEGSYYRFYVR